MTDSIRQAFLDQHRHLARAFSELRNASEGADAPTLRASWLELERTLLAHLEAEEQDLLPVLEVRHPAECGRIREEHVQIRASLEELGLQVELHAIRDDILQAFVDRLEAHARGEETGLYAFADAELEQGRREAAIRRVIEAFRARV